jgi:hypothetical protein
MASRAYKNSIYQIIVTRGGWGLDERKVEKWAFGLWGSLGNNRQPQKASDMRKTSRIYIALGATLLVNY